MRNFSFSDVFVACFVFVSICATVTILLYKPPQRPPSLSMLCVETSEGEFIDISMADRPNELRCIYDLPPGKYLIDVAATTDFCMDPVAEKIHE